jgi:hypothetical protein
VDFILSPRRSRLLCKSTRICGLTNRRSQRLLAIAVPLSRSTSQIRRGSAFFVRRSATLYESTIYSFGFRSTHHDGFRFGNAALRQLEATGTFLASRVSARGCFAWFSHQSVPLCRSEHHHRFWCAEMVIYILFHEHAAEN